MDTPKVELGKIVEVRLTYKIKTGIEYPFVCFTLFGRDAEVWLEKLKVLKSSVESHPGIFISKWVEHQEKYFSNEHERWGFGSKVNFSAFKDYLPEINAKVLDIGCNDGGTVKRLVEMGYDPYGIDLPPVVKKAQAKYPQIVSRLSVCNLEYDELPGGPYKLVLAIGVIEHIIGFRFFLLKVAKVLDGILYLATSDRNARDWEVAPFHIHHFTENELSQLAREAGLETVKFTKTSDTDLTGIFKKVVE